MIIFFLSIIKFCTKCWIVVLKWRNVFANFFTSKTYSYSNKIDSLRSFNAKVPFIFSNTFQLNYHNFRDIARDMNLINDIFRALY